jgi:hypothetical protein
MVPDACLSHERPSTWRDRYSKGTDAITVFGEDSTLRGAKYLRYRALMPLYLYTRNVLMDWRRVLGYRGDLEINLLLAVLALPLFPLIRLIDLLGMLRGVTMRPLPSG